MSFLLILSSVLILAVTYYVFKHLEQLWKYSHIPGVSQILPSTPFPFPIPLLAPYTYRGSYKTMLQLHERFKQYPVFRLTSGHTTFIVTNCREVTKQIMIKNAGNYPKPPEMYGPLLMYGENIVSVDGGEIHRKHRRIVEPAFQEKNLRALVDISNESTDLLLKRLEKDRVMEVNADMTDVTMDIIGKSNFGVDLNVFHESDPNAKHTLFDKSKYKRSFYDALELTNTLGIAIWNFVPVFMRPLWIFKSGLEAVSEVQEYILDIVSQRRENGIEGRSDLVSLLLESNESGETKLTNQEIVSDAFIFLFAGHETSATNLGHLLCELAKNQDVQDKCIEEIDRVLEGRAMTYDDFDLFPYINNCVKETLRLHSPVSMVPKVAKSKDNLGGYSIPKGTYVWVDFYIAMRDERSWKDPLAFNPDRFNEKYEAMAFLPFSFGARKCVGFQFSLVETLAILVRILQKYRVEFEAGIDPKTHQPKEAVLVTVKIDKQNLMLRPRSQ